MQTIKNDMERFSLLLNADLKLVEAIAAMNRAGLTREIARVEALREVIARRLQAIQDDSYSAVARGRARA
ncbi:MAG TPA: hypothetical protein VGG48_16365 [Rhizomicrobium sp.]|jgi:hypothetical protein